ncbi:MAG: beta-ketoacyl synthase chain length factor, partial [Opitutaceae bacterium]|nr:beta-ketoacyl synthase chain length factor [Opitutaceae bacterium]
MLERLIQTIRTDDPGDEDVAATRERLKGNFPPATVRRMTQLGMLMSAILDELAPRRDDAIIYATQYGEGRTLERFLDSFPAASPTGFQTSIHPGAVQQGMIRRARPVGEFFPMSGSDWLAGHSLLAAFLSPAPRVLLCGGEERGTWLTVIDGASTRTFAYGMSLVSNDSADPAQPPAGRITLEPDTGIDIDIGTGSNTGSNINTGTNIDINTNTAGTNTAGTAIAGTAIAGTGTAIAAAAATPLAPGAWFDLLHARKNFSGTIA